DVSDLDRAEQLAKEMAPWFGVVKVGLELYSAAGPDAVAHMRALDLDVFADIKLHDIPTTVGSAARVLGRQGVRYLNFHAAGGVDMLRAGVEGLAEGARDAGHSHAIPIAVTVLTSDPDARAFDERLARKPPTSCSPAQSRYAASLLIRELIKRARIRDRNTPSRRRNNMVNPPTLTPEQRQLALEKAAVARRQRAEVKDKLKIGSLTLRERFDAAERGDESGDMLAKLKVVSVLESLPGVGKVRARHLMSELEISESRRLR